MQHFLAAPSLELSIPVPYAPERPGMFYDLCTGHSLLTWKALPQSPRAQLKLYLLSGILTDPHIPKCTNMLAQRNSFNSVAQSCSSLCDPMNCSTPGLPVHHQLLEFNQTHVHWVSDAIQPSQPLSSLLLLPSIFPSLRVFSNESALRMRWPKYWSFSFSISPFNEHPGLILQSKGLSRVFSNTTVQKHQFFGAQLSSQSNCHIHTWLLEKP